MIGRTVARFSVFRMIVTIAAVLSLVTVVVVALAVAALSEVHATSERLVSGSVHPLTYLSQVQVDVQASRIQMRDVALAAEGAATETAMDKVTAGDAKLDKDIATYLAAGAADPAAVQTFQQTWAQWRTARDATLVPAAKAKDFAAYVTAQKVTTPLSVKATEGLAAVVTAEEHRANANGESARRIFVTTRGWLIGVALAGLVLGLWVSWLIARAMVASIRDVGSVLNQVAEGDLTSRAVVVGHNELAAMAGSLNRAVSAMQATVTSIAGEATSIASSAENLSAVTAQIAGAAEETAHQASVVSEAAQDVSRHAQTVASGAEEMGASISEIANNTTQAVALGQAGNAAAESGKTNIARLTDSSTEIGSVVKLITAIAEQTNLLALNATIEAARAGDAGKGFAVVANEVKDLAHETAKATEDISGRITTIQADSGGATDTVRQVAEILAQLGDFQTVIASAVEEQTATTQEMSRSAAEAAQAADAIAANIAAVADAAQSTSQGVTRVEATATDLARASTTLEQLIAGFTYQGTGAGLTR